MELVVIFWVLCGIGSAIVAASKGRSGCGWLILGFALGPIGLLMSAGMSNLKHTAAIEQLKRARRTEAAPLRPCPVCAEQIQPGAIKCRFCGADVAPIVVAPASPPASRGLGYAIGRAISENNLSPWWLLLIGIGLIVMVRACATL